MAKSGISFKFDSKKFERNLKKDLQKIVDETSVEFTCPNCGCKLEISKGINNCPSCQTPIGYHTELTF